MRKGPAPFRILFGPRSSARMGGRMQYSAFPTDLAGRRELYLSHGPRGAAEAFLLALAGVPADTQRAALCGLPTVPALIAAFESAWDLRAGPIAGAPFLVKDLYAVAGARTGAGSAFYTELAPPVPRDAALVAHARESGAVFAGKTQLNEFAFGMTGENPHFGDCPHPAGRGLLAGGSSSGSAWAVGSGLVPWALASDTAGSIRVPSSWCGAYGVRLTPGLTDPDELLPLSPSYDTAGWIAGTADDLRAVTGVLLGGVRDPAAPARVLYLSGYAADALEPAVRSACEREARRRGWEFSAAADALFASVCDGVERDYPVLGGAEAAAVHRRLLADHASRYDPVVVARLRAGATRTEAEIGMAAARRDRVRAMFAEFFELYDALAWPCVPCVAQPAAGHDDALRASLLRLNTPVSLAGLPASSFPVAVPGTGLTAGIQLVSADLRSLVLP